MLNGAITFFTHVSIACHFALVTPPANADSVPPPMSELSVRESVAPCPTAWTVQPPVHGFRYRMWLSTTLGTEPGGRCTGCIRRCIGTGSANAGDANAAIQTATPARRLIYRRAYLGAGPAFYRERSNDGGGA